jgi:hypothetical protein
MQSERETRNEGFDTTMTHSLGRRLLVWSDSNELSLTSGSRGSAAMTKKEMAELLSASCQTIIRMSSVFENQQLIAQHSCTLSDSSSAQLEPSVHQ